MPYSEQKMTTLRARSKRFNPLVVALAYDGLCAFEFACTAEVFGLPRPELGPGWYRFQTCSMGGRPVRGQYATRMSVDGGLESLALAGTIMVPGWKGIEVPVPEPIIEALREAYHRGARLLSICSGAFVLAATGLLDGRRATTHWKYAEALQARFPGVQVEPDVLYADEGRILTSAGSAAGLDLCLHLVRRDFGSGVANVVARRLVIPPHRDGGQAQFIEQPVDRDERGQLSTVLERAKRSIDRPVTIADMARWASTSPRTLIRRVRAATGLTPGEWITGQRVARAKELLEQSKLGADEVARRCGFGTTSTLRHHFRKRVGLSPSEYRRRFALDAQSRAAPG